MPAAVKFRLADLNREEGLPPSLLALNNEFAQELSYLCPEKAARLVREAVMACRVGEADALLLAFDQNAAYENPNFEWFRDRYERFIYIDRVVVAPAMRGRGLARELYRAIVQSRRCFAALAGGLRNQPGSTQPWLGRVSCVIGFRASGARGPATGGKNRPLFLAQDRLNAGISARRARL